MTSVRYWSRDLLMGVCGTDREIAGSIIVGRIRSFKPVCGRVTVLSVCVTPCNDG